MTINVSITVETAQRRRKNTPLRSRCTLTVGQIISIPYAGFHCVDAQKNPVFDVVDTQGQAKSLMREYALSEIKKRFTPDIQIVSARVFFEDGRGVATKQQKEKRYEQKMGRYDISFLQQEAERCPNVWRSLYQ